MQEVDFVALDAAQWLQLPIFVVPKIIFTLHYVIPNKSAYFETTPDLCMVLNRWCGGRNDMGLCVSRRVLLADGYAAD